MIADTLVIFGAVEEDCVAGFESKEEALEDVLGLETTLETGTADTIFSLRADDGALRVVPLAGVVVCFVVCFGN